VTLLLQNGRISILAGRSRLVIIYVIANPHPVIFILFKIFWFLDSDQFLNFKFSVFVRGTRSNECRSIVISCDDYVGLCLVVYSYSDNE